ncbi:hypothetical protein BB559_002949 [Furculomyces boomerangus]|uniref:Anaphase-promoting complex subunit 4 WD40 domain-containing protein n=1 Tax=Furculomyces boomerangus TaxID=61424 RepID=A0A2T9YQN2_9FUNG|nr:hypothetical protein BB559_002949 [Furculomyces boomerangus]
MSLKQSSEFVPAPSVNRGQVVHIYPDSKHERIVYASGKSIIIRGIKDPSLTSVYQGHIYQTTVAKFSPSGYYVASGDINGNVRIWDAVNEEHILKSEFRPISGAIRDISWDPDSQRVLVVGEGKEKFGHVFTFDSENSVGTIDGHSKVVNGCSMRTKRPFRAVTCSDDMTVVFFQGTPYKYVKAIRDHSGFVNDVKYSPDGSYFVSVGSDQKILMYDGLNGDLIGQIGTPQTNHKGSIYAVSWSPDSKKIMTSSGDKTVKIWDVETKDVLKTVKIGNDNSPMNMQMGNVWTEDYMLSVSLSGDINILSKEAEVPEKILQSHQKSITASVIDSDDLLYTGSMYEEPRVIEGSSQVNCLALGRNGKDIVIGTMDDTVSFMKEGRKVKLPGAPKHMGYVYGSDTLVASLSTNKVVFVESNGEVKEIREIPETATCVAVHPSKAEIAVGFNDNSVNTYSVVGNEVKIKEKMNSNRRAITSLSYSESGKYIASGDGAGKIYVFETGSGELVTGHWVYHTAAINGMVWMGDEHMVSCSLDTNVYVWSIKTPSQHTALMNIHSGGVNCIASNGQKVVTCGVDGVIKTFLFS